MEVFYLNRNDMRITCPCGRCPKVKNFYQHIFTDYHWNQSRKLYKQHKLSIKYRNTQKKVEKEIKKYLNIL